MLSSGAAILQETSDVNFTSKQTSSDEGFFLLSGLSNKPACYICGKIISNLQNLYKHIRTIHQRQESRCDYCGSVFRNAESARKHVLKLHREDIGHGLGLSKLEPLENSSWSHTGCCAASPHTITNIINSTTTNTTSRTTINTTSPVTGSLQLHSIKTEDLT